ncbi:MFS transporter [Pseudomonas protegens]|nr:MFS transporter [Pseudomonas protegens]
MRKVSRRLLGFLFVCFVLSFLDRINIGFAGLTMMDDLGLSSTQFGMATTLFYIAYIAFGIPSNIALAADRPSPATADEHSPLRLREVFSSSVIKFSLVYFCLVNTLAMIAVWTPLIVKSITAPGSSHTLIGFLATIPQVCTVIGMLCWGLHSDRSQERKWHLVLPMLMAATGWLFAAYAPNPVLQLLGICMAATGSYSAMSIFWTTPDQAMSFQARAIGIAVINAFGNIGSAVNPLVVGWLRDSTQSFTAGIVYATVLLVIGSLLVFLLPIKPAPQARVTP